VYKDLHPHYIRLVYSNYNNEYTFDQALTKSLEDFSPYLKKFNGLLGEKLFIAGELTWFDFALADFLQTLSLLHPSYQNPYPKLIEYYQRIWGLPELKPYFNSQRYRERPCNNYTATWK
jgi:glutathione S-transferase